MQAKNVCYVDCRVDSYILLIRAIRILIRDVYTSLFFRVVKRVLTPKSKELTLFKKKQNLQTERMHTEYVFYVKRKKNIQSVICKVILIYFHFLR